MPDLTTNWFHKVDGTLGLAVHRHRFENADSDLVRELVRDLDQISHEARLFAESGIADRYGGGFPITLESMVKFAEIHGKLDELRILVAAAIGDTGEKP